MATETYFSGEDPSGPEGIWETNGTVAGTIEIVKGYGTSNKPYGDFVRVGARIVFEGEDSRFVNGLITTEGTAATTYEIIPTYASRDLGLDPADLATVGDVVVFNGIDNREDYDLWESNGTQAGTKIVPGTTNLDPRNMFTYKTEVLFTSINKGGLWTTNGSSVREIAGTSKLVAEEFTVSGSNVYFADSRTGSIYVTDGTAAHTRRLFSAFNPIDLTAVGNKLVFEAEDRNGNYDLFTSNGTTAGTHQIAGTTGMFNTLVDGDGDPLPPDFTLFDGKLLFEGVDKAGEFGLWTTNGTTATEITGIKGAFSNGIFGQPNDPDFNGPDFAVDGKYVFFDGVSSGGLGAPDFGVTNLWVTNGTAAGTRALKGSKIDGYSSTLGLDPSNMTTLPEVTPVKSAAALSEPVSRHTAELTAALFEGAFGPSTSVDPLGYAGESFRPTPVLTAASHASRD